MTDATSAGDDDDTESKLELLEWTYGEVLDATKHQDDKIGRLLTAIAFLTAAALALANLAQGDVIRARFEVGNSPLPLGLYALTAFLFGVLLTVVLLVTSFATPLRLPGLQQPSKEKRPSYVTDTRTSQIYFSEISGVSVSEWQEKWAVDARALKQERLESLVLETHNLSLRTIFKYQRTSEAIAVLSFALLLFALAVLFATFAATTARRLNNIPVVELGSLQCVAIGAILGVYTWIHILSRLRYNYQAVTEPYSKGDGKEKWLNYWCQRVLAVVIPLAIGLTTLSYADRWVLPGQVAITALTLATCVCLVLIEWSRQQLSDDGADNTLHRPASDQTRRRNWTIVACVVVIIAGSCALWSIGTDEYRFQLFVGLAAVFLLVFTSAVEPTRSAGRARRSYEDREARRAPGQRDRSVTESAAGATNGALESSQGPRTSEEGPQRD